MKALQLLSIVFLLFACSEQKEETIEAQTIETKAKPNEENVWVDSVDVEEEESTISTYRKGRHEKAEGEGAILLLIHPLTDSTCRFVFDTRSTESCWAKLAGNLKVDKKGKASYSAINCTTLDFHFTKDGISVKEYNCKTFHSRKCAFDGFYTLQSDADNDDVDPIILVEQFQKEETNFDFYASFTEPFWTLYFVGDKVVFDQAEGAPELYNLSAPFDVKKAKQTITFKAGDHSWKVFIENIEGSDGMSDISYPYHVVLDDDFYGGGAEVFQKEEY